MGSSQGDNLVMMSEFSEWVGDISSYKDRKVERYEEVYRQERENFIFNAFINFRDGWSTCILSTNQLIQNRTVVCLIVTNVCNRFWQQKLAAD